MIDRCRSCRSDRLSGVLYLGNQYLSDFGDTPDYRPLRYPLELVRCLACGLAQLTVTVPRDLLYHDRYGFYSGVNEIIRDDLADVVRTARRYVPYPQAWLDIASNDGTLLSFVPPGCYRVGIDPVAKFRELARRHADTILPTYFSPDLFGITRFDVVTSVSVFYDLDDPNEFVAGVKQILHPNGVWLIQQNYLLAMLERTSFDNICHEHLTYWALGPLMALLEAHGLEVLDVSTSSINGGSFRTLVGHVGRRNPAPSVREQLNRENLAGLGLVSEYEAFAGRAQLAIMGLRDHIRMGPDGEVVDIYGASTRGAVIWQAAGLGPATVRQAVERNPDKVGRWYSPVGVPIVSETQMREDPPDLLLLGPYWLLDGTLKRERAYLESGGRLVVPLPELRVIDKEEL